MGRGKELVRGKPMWVDNQHPNKPQEAVGTVKVVNGGAVPSLEALDEALKGGEVLVCQRTFAGQDVPIGRAVAVVANAVGKAGNTAVTCKGLGIPGVRQTQFGTEILTDGMKVVVDGVGGVVYEYVEDA